MKGPMRKFLAVIVVTLFAAAGMVPADAQVRIKPYGNQGQVFKGNRQRGQQVKPRMLLLPPSAALKRALRAMPNAKPLGVKLRGDTYVVRLKSGGTIIQLGVDSVTGAVFPLR